MGKTLLSGFLSIVTAVCWCQASVVLKIGNLKNDKGVCRACLFDNEASFIGKVVKPRQCSSAMIRGQQTEVQFDGIPPGSYAILVYHDVNNNNQLDKNFMGVPKEGYGASGNKLPFAAAPTF